jgi:ElaB/YqjD/DUF883 family membrane-anchored ribosome-binding protein
MADESNQGTPLMAQAKQQAQHAVQQGRDGMSHVWDMARGEFRARLTGQKDKAATKIEDFAALIRATGSQLKDQGHPGSSVIADQIADRLGALGETVHDKDIEELLADTEDFARQRPVVFLSVAALLGFVLARFLKSSGSAAAAA